jgi:hypothetical protein
VGHLMGEADRDALGLDDIEGRTDLPFESFEDSAIEPPIVLRFRAIAGRFAARVAIDDGVARLTYGEARRIVCHLARRIEIVVPPRHCFQNRCRPAALRRRGRQARPRPHGRSLPSSADVRPVPRQEG